MIRPAEQSDAASVAALWNWMIRDTLATFTSQEKSVPEVADMIGARGGAFFVAEITGRLHGFVTFGPFRGGDGYARTCEHSVIVARDAQAQGVGRDLMHRAQTAAVDRDMHVMIAAISSANRNAVAFHERLGFVHSGTLQQVGRKNERWLDLILMQKKLGAGG